MGLHQIKKFLHIKKKKTPRYWNQDTTHRMEISFCQLFNIQVINIQNTQRAQKTKQQKNK
jgi:hypothetical protein